MESLRERRLAFRRRNTVKNGRGSYNQQEQPFQPSHPVHFHDRQFHLSIDHSHFHPFRSIIFQMLSSVFTLINLHQRLAYAIL